MPRIPKIVTENTLDGMHLTDEPLLAQVCTLQEASALWRKSQTTLRYQLFSGKVAGRLSLTGGTIMLYYPDLIKLYGEPENKLLEEICI